MSAHQAKFVWYELLTSDPQAAESFYHQVIGWEGKDSGSPVHAYTLLSMGDAMVAGLMALPEEAKAMGARPGWMAYIAVDDVDAYVTRVTATGGKVYKAAEDIANVGRFAVVGDVHGAGFVLFKGMGEEPPAVPPGTPGHIGWHELFAGDLDSAFAFYSELFGWTKADAIDMGPMGVYQLFAIDGVAVGGMMTKPANIPKPFWGYYINVEAIDAAIARATQHGGQVLNGPHQVPGGSWIVQCLDPQGALFNMVANQK